MGVRVRTSCPRKLGTQLGSLPRDLSGSRLASIPPSPSRPPTHVLTLRFGCIHECPVTPYSSSPMPQRQSFPPETISRLCSSVARACSTLRSANRLRRPSNSAVRDEGNKAARGGITWWGSQSRTSRVPRVLWLMLLPRAQPKDAHPDTAVVPKCQPTSTPCDSSDELNGRPGLQHPRWNRPSARQDGTLYIMSSSIVHHDGSFDFASISPRGGWSDPWCVGSEVPRKWRAAVAESVTAIYPGAWRALLGGSAFPRQAACRWAHAQMLLTSMPASLRFSTSPTRVPQGGQPFDLAPMRPFFLRMSENPSSMGLIPCDIAVST